MELKNYIIQNVNQDKLFSEIYLSNSVLNFSGLSFCSEILTIIGDSLLDEESLDIVIENHNPICIPYSITPRQARQALMRYGITEEMILSAIESLPNINNLRSDARITWEYSVEFHRDNPLVVSMANILGWTSAQLDSLWILGSTL